MAQVSPLNDFIILLVKFGYVLAAYGNLGNKVLIYFTTRVSSNQSFAHLCIDDGNKVLTYFIMDQGSEIDRFSLKLKTVNFRLIRINLRMGQN